MDTIEGLNQKIIACTKCPRLVEYREEVARTKRRMYRESEYWGRPLPGFGDPEARVLLVGLAPAAHGGNRTGRMFTGDRSGDWVYGTLHKFGFANQPTSLNREDGLALEDAYITAALRCAPPANKPLREELLVCRPYLLQELRLLKRLRVVVALGKIAFDAYLATCRELSTTGEYLPTPRPPLWPRRDMRPAHRHHPGLLVPSQPAEHPDWTPHQGDVRGCFRNSSSSAGPGLTMDAACGYYMT